MTVSSGRGTRDVVRRVLAESAALGLSDRDTLRSIAKTLSIGTPAARSIRDFVVRNPRGPRSRPLYSYTR